MCEVLTATRFDFPVFFSGQNDCHQRFCVDYELMKITDRTDVLPADFSSVALLGDQTLPETVSVFNRLNSEILKTRNEKSC